MTMGLVNKWSQCLNNKQCCFQLTIQYLSHSRANKTSDKQSIKDRTLAGFNWGANKTSDKQPIQDRTLAGFNTNTAKNTLLK